MTTAIDRDGAALLRAIEAQPEEDTPRLLFADWLDENGRVRRVECPECKRKPAKCPKCKGKGRINVYKGVATYKRMMSCRSCNGTGKGVSCSHCSGTGYVEHNPDADRAELIRVQVELAQIGHWAYPDGGRLARRGAELTARSDALLARNRRDWFGCPACKGTGTALDPKAGHDPHYCPTCRCSGNLLSVRKWNPDYGEYQNTFADRPHRISRGFVEWVGASLGEWGEEVEGTRWCEDCQKTWVEGRDGQMDKVRECQSCGGTNRIPITLWQPTPLARAVAALPWCVRGLRVTDREPTHNVSHRRGAKKGDSGWDWYRASRFPNSRAGLPGAVFYLIKTAWPERISTQYGSEFLEFDTAELAHAALGTAMLKLTREAKDA